MSLYDNDPAFAGIDQIAAPEGDGDFGPDFIPPVGPAVVTISATKFDRSKKGELYVKVEYQRDDGNRWSVVKEVTKNGQPDEGRVKSTRILLRQHGLDGTLPASQWAAALASLVGRRAQVDVVQDGQWLNTNVRGVDAARAPAPTPVAQSPVFSPPPQAPVPAPIQEHVAAQSTPAAESPIPF